MNNEPMEQYAIDCLKQWGNNQGYGGPKGYPRTSSFIINPKGIDTLVYNEDTMNVVSKMMKT